MTVLDHARAIDAPTWVTASLALILIALVLNDTVLGRREYGRLIAALAVAPPEKAPQVRARFLMKWAWQPWVLTLLTVAFVALAPGVALNNLGFAWPDLSGPIEVVSEGGFLSGALIGVAIGFAGLTVVVIIALVRALAGAHDRVAQPVDATGVNSRLAPMLPTERVDRRAWLMLSVTAGVTEEIMYRGLALVTFALLLPTAPSILIYALVTVVFALAHLYQGWRGILTTGLLGAVFVALFVTTGSLLPGMLLHTLIDARSAVPPRK